MTRQCSVGTVASCVGASCFCSRASIILIFIYRARKFFFYLVQQLCSTRQDNNNNNNSWISKRYCLEGFIVALTNAASRDSCGENRLGLAIPIPIYVLTYIAKSPPRNFPSFP